MRTYVDELKNGIRFSSGGPVSISLETAKRLVALYEAADNCPCVDEHTDKALDALYVPMPEPKP